MRCANFVTTVGLRACAVVSGGESVTFATATPAAPSSSTATTRSATRPAPPTGGARTVVSEGVVRAAASGAPGQEAGATSEAAAATSCA